MKGNFQAGYIYTLALLDSGHNNADTTLLVTLEVEAYILSVRTYTHNEDIFGGRCDVMEERLITYRHPQVSVNPFHCKVTRSLPVSPDASVRGVWWAMTINICDLQLFALVIMIMSSQYNR